MIKLHILKEMTHYLNQKLPNDLIHIINDYIFNFAGTLKTKLELNSIRSICVITDHLIVAGLAQNEPDNGLTILYLNDPQFDQTIISSPIIGSEEIYFIKLLSRDKKQIITMPYYCDEGICVWDLETKSRFPLKGIQLFKQFCIVDILLDGKIIFGSCNEIVIYDLITNTYEQIKHTHRSICCFLKILPENKFVTWSIDETIKIWDVPTKEIISTIEAKGQSINSENTQHITYIQKTLSSESNQSYEETFIVGSICNENLDPFLIIWDLHGKEIKRIKIDSCITCIESYCNDYIITGSIDGIIRMWDPLNLDICILSMSGHKSGINCICVLPNGNIISSSNEEMIIWK